MVLTISPGVSDRKHRLAHIGLLTQDSTGTGLGVVQDTGSKSPAAPLAPAGRRTPVWRCLRAGCEGPMHEFSEFESASAAQVLLNATVDSIR